MQRSFPEASVPERSCELRCFLHWGGRLRAAAHGFVLSPLRGPRPRLLSPSCALVLLGRLYWFLDTEENSPWFKLAERLEIINLSSVSGIYPMPYFAIYSATKGALTSFSQALREEMRGKNVAVTAILPGAMPTRLDIQEQIKGQGLWGKLAAKSPKSVAEASLKAVRKNKRKVIIGFWNNVMRISTCWIPAPLRLRFIARRWSKISKDAF